MKVGPCVGFVVGNGQEGSIKQPDPFALLSVPSSCFKCLGAQETAAIT